MRFFAGIFASRLQQIPPKTSNFRRCSAFPRARARDERGAASASRHDDASAQSSETARARRRLVEKTDPWGSDRGAGSPRTPYILLMDVVRVRRLCGVSLYRAHGTACLSRLNLVTSLSVAEFAFLSPVIAPETTISRRDERRARVRELWGMKRRCWISRAGLEQHSEKSSL